MARAFTPTERECRLVREAAVTAYVRGVMHAGGIMRVDVPRDSEMIRQALETADSHSDLYPTLARMRRADQ